MSQLTVGSDILSVPYGPRVRAAAERYGYRECVPCAAGGDTNPKGPVHRRSRVLWVQRRDRAIRNGGTDPVTDATAALAMWHLDVLGSPVAALTQQAGRPSFAARNRPG